MDFVSDRYNFSVVNLIKKKKIYEKSGSGNSKIGNVPGSGF